MTYGGYSFSPVPLIRISKDYNKTEDGTKVGTTFTVTLDGTITPWPTGTTGLDTGITNTVVLLDRLREALTDEGRAFVILCDSTILWSGHPRIGTIEFTETPTNWVDTIDYTVPLMFDIEGSGEDPSLQVPYIETASENWTVEFNDSTTKYAWTLPTAGLDQNPYILNMTHTISAKGKRHFIADETVDKEPWEYARQYVISKLSTGTDSAANTQLAASGILNYSTLSNVYNHSRVQNTDVLGGGFSVTESWMVMSAVNVPGHAIEDFTADVQRNANDDITTININGSIQGVDIKTYGSDPGDFTLTQTKYSAASGYWNTVSSRLYYRAQLLHNLEMETKANNVRTLNTTALSQTVAHNPTKGVITYSYSYNDRPSNCITGALVESISIVDTNPNDVFAQLSILGRAIGPIFQDINTVTAPTREVSIELIGPPTTACTAAGLLNVTGGMKEDVTTLICGWETALSGIYDQVFKTADSESWSPKDGRYSRRVSWTYQDCDTTQDSSTC